MAMQISESELNRIITESINKLLNEGEFFGDDAYRSKLRKQGVSGNDIKNREKNSKWGAVQKDNKGNISAIPKGDKSHWGNAKPVKPGGLDEGLAEGVEDEGLFNRLGSAFKGAKQGYQAQKSLDRGTDDFKQQHDFDDVRKSMDNPLSKMDKTAEEQATHLYNQYKQYQQQANKMLNMYNAICKKYGLQKKAVGQHATTEPAPTGTGVNFSTPNANNKFGRKTSSRDTGHLKNSWFEEEE